MKGRAILTALALTALALPVTAQPGVTDPIALASTGTVDCVDMEVDVEGDWQRGSSQSDNTWGRFRYYDGPGQSMNPSFTAWTDLGAGSTGTHMDSVPYNNAAGTSFHLQVREGDPALGNPVNTFVAIYAAPEQCDLGAPPETGNAVHDEPDFQIQVSQAQCNGDSASIVVSTDADPDEFNVTIIRVTDGVVVQVFDGTDFLNGPRSYWRGALYLPGVYAALAFWDRPGLLSPDAFDLYPFNVPTGTCIDNSGLVLDAIAGHDANMSANATAILDAIQGLNATLQAQLTATLDALLAAIAAHDANLTANITLVLDAIQGLNATNQASFTEVLDAIAGHNATMLSEFAAICSKIIASEGNLTALIEAIDIFQNITGNFTGNLTFKATNQLFQNSTFNGTIDLSILNAILTNITDHRNASIEVGALDFEGLAFDGWLILLFWLLVMAWAWWQGLTLLGLISMTAAAVQFFDTPPIAFAGFVFLAITAYALEYFAKGRLSGWMQTTFGRRS